MKITSAPAESSPFELELLLASKSSAATLFKSGSYGPSAVEFASTAHRAQSDFPKSPSALKLAAACLSNASAAWLKAGDPVSALGAAGECLEVCGELGGDAESLETKALFRSAEASMALAEGMGEDAMGRLADAREALEKVLGREPGNEMALGLAERGLELAGRVREAREGRHDYSNYDDDAEGVAAPVDAMKALGVQEDGVAGGWGMNPHWKPPTDFVAVPQPKTHIPDPTSSPAEVSMSSLLSSARAELRASKPILVAPTISESTDPAWSELESEEAKLNSTYDSIVASTYSVPLNLKTAESSYSDGWRSTHAARRFEGKDPSLRATKAKAVWEGLAEEEDGAVRAVNEKLEEKAKLKEMKETAMKSNSKPKEVGEKGWRKRLKQRRQGSEIAVKPKAEGSVSSDWDSMLLSDAAEIDRVNKLKEERRKAEKEASKKKKAKKGQIKKMID